MVKGETQINELGNDDHINLVSVKYSLIIVFLSRRVPGSTSQCVLL